MRGVAVLKPFQWELDVQGESWEQGQELTGTLRLTNLDAAAQTLSGKLQLALGELKKVHARDPKAFKEIQVLALAPQQLAPGAALVESFRFALPQNGHITDKKQGPYLAYGPTGVEANLLLNVRPRQLFQEVGKILETFQRFKPKDIKNGKDCVELKFAAPSSRDYAHVEGLELSLAMQDELLMLDFLFKVKTLDTQSVTTKVAKDEKLIHLELTKRQYDLGRGLLNQDGVLKALDEALAGVRMKGL